jgi:hypothetical protein
MKANLIFCPDDHTVLIMGQRTVRKLTQPVQSIIFSIILAATDSHHQPQI